jgi:hypothetical protein
MASVALGLSLVACGSDGGQQTPNDRPDTEYHNAQQGTDIQDIETYDANVQVQKIVVDGIECVLAVRGGSSEYGMALSCPGTTTTGVTP